MAMCKVRKGIQDNQGTKKPSPFFWRVETASTAGKGTSRKKKNSSGGVTGVKQKVQSCSEASKENEVPKVDKRSHQRRPSLKELCPEDKHRVRLLIEQLARTSCEKEAMEDQVKEERKQFTILLEKLKEEHHKVVQEKKELESELHASQLHLQSIHTYPPSVTASHSTSSSMGFTSASVVSAPPLTTATIAGSSVPSLTSTVHTHSLPVTSLTGPITGIVLSSATSVAPTFSPMTTSLIKSATSSYPPTSAYHVTSSGTSPTASAVVYPTRSSQPPNVSTCNHQPLQVSSSLTRQCPHQHEVHTTALPSVHATYPEYFVTPSMRTESTVTRVQRRTCARPTILTETAGQVHVPCNTACPPKFPESVLRWEREMVHPPSCEVESSVCNNEVQGQSLGFPPGNDVNISRAQWQRSVDCPPSSHFVNSEVQRNSMTYPPSLLSTTTVNQGFPLSSTHMQCPQQECRHQPNSTDADPIVLHDCTCPTSNDDAKMIIPGVVNNPEHDHKGSHSRDYQASHRPKILGDRTNHTSVAGSLLTPTKAAASRWLSLPSALPDENSLMQNGQSGRHGSCVEVGTQTLMVETVGTQTDNMDEHEPEHVIYEPDHVTKEPLHMSCGPSDLPKKGVDSKAVSVTEPLSATTGTFQPLGHTGEGHHDPIGFVQCSDKDTSMEELLATSDLLNNHLGLSVRLSGSQQSVDFISASKNQSMMVSISEPLDYDLAVSLNSHGHHSPLPLHSSSSLPPSDHIQDTTSCESTPMYTNYPYYGVCQIDREKMCVDDSSLIEQLFFI